eukprot:1522781-Prymnesium_polylepis.1
MRRKRSAAVCLGSKRAAGPVKGPRARRESKALHGGSHGDPRGDRSRQRGGALRHDRDRGRRHLGLLDQ